MYVWRMKKPLKYSSAPTPPDVLRDVPGPTIGGDEAVGMVRTQIYLTRAEHGFIAAEAARRGEPMAAVIRGYIDDKMRLPDSAWAANPMLEPTPPDAEASSTRERPLPQPFRVPWPPAPPLSPRPRDTAGP